MRPGNHCTAQNTTNVEPNMVHTIKKDGVIPTTSTNVHLMRDSFTANWKASSTDLKVTFREKKASCKEYWDYMNICFW